VRSAVFHVDNVACFEAVTWGREN